MRKTIYIIIFITLSNSLNFFGMNVIFRYDDYTLKHNDLDEQIINEFIKNNCNLTIGIIPVSNNRILINPKYLFLNNILKPAVKTGKIEIALHGWKHEKINGIPEFSYYSKKEQSQMIFIGKNYLESIFNTHITTFIPPYNSYNQHTLDALQINSFKIISADMYGLGITSNTIERYPCTICDNINLISPTIELNRNKDCICIILLHRYDFYKKNKNYLLLSKTLKQIKEEKIRVTNFQEIDKEGYKTNTDLIKLNLQTNLLGKLLKNKNVIYSSEYLYIIKIINLFLYFILFTFLYIPIIAIRKKYKLTKRLIYTILLSYLLITILVFYHFQTPIRLILITIAISSINYLYLFLLLKKKNKFIHKGKQKNGIKTQ